MKVLTDISVTGKRVFLRADLDVNVEQLTEVTRLQGLKPTVDYLLEHGARQIVIAGHVGRPVTKHVTRDTGHVIMRFYDEKLSTKNLIEPLEKVLGQRIVYMSGLSGNQDIRTSGIKEVGEKPGNLVTRIPDDPQIVLLENLRFWEGEEKNDPEFVKVLASLADVYVNDAFGVCHRAHASIVGVPGLLPHGAGLHLEEEVNQLTKLIKNSQRPMVAIIGGAKLETKIPVIESMAKVADWVLVGGLIAKEVQSAKFKVQNFDRVIVASLTQDTRDISNESIGQFTEIIKNAKTVVWNGPMGIFEEGFEVGTMAIAEAVIQSGSYSVVGGGETTQFLSLKNLLGKFSFVSSGGGAMLEYLSGKELPGVKALE